MAPDDVPDEVRALADARSTARRARDFETADALRAQIEAAGWKVVDAASLYSLERGRRPRTSSTAAWSRTGSSASVPSRLDGEPIGVATVVLVATDWPEDVAERSMR